MITLGNNISHSSSAKERWQALDGLRGLAAIVVMFSHTGFAFNLLKETGLVGRIAEPVLFGLLTPGGMAVQILFVLCGFLMASLYPQIKSRTYFLQKRYSRIFPVYTAVVTYAAITQTITYTLPPIVNIAILLSILILWHLVWRMIATHDKQGLVRLGIFIIFFAIQMLVIFFDVVIGARFIKDSGLQIPFGAQGVAMYLNNIVLATPFLRYIGRYQPLYWSLGLEVLFYVVYALGIGQNIQRLGRLNVWQGVFIIAGCVAVLFSIDSGFRTTLELVNLSFNRSSGFLVGILLGIAYAQKNILHRGIEWISRQKILMIIGSLLTIACLYMERTVPHLASYEGMMWYWLIASIMIGITLYLSLLPYTLAHRIFSSRFLMYWGMISYSAYLLHEHMLPLINQVASNNTLSDSVLKNLSQLLFTFVAASISYYLVERPYFTWRIPELAVHSVTAKFHFLSRINASTSIKAVFGMSLLLLFVSGIFQASLSPRMRGYYMPLDSKWSLFPSTTEKVLPNTEHVFKFVSPDDFLASIAIDLHYFGENEKYRKDPNAAHFIVQVYGPDSDQPLVTSDRLALDVAGQPYYPIGIPLQEHSRGKTYTVKIAVRNGHADDYLFIRPTRHNLLAIYQYPISMIKTPIGAVSHLFNRITLGLSHTNAIVILIAIATIAGILNIDKKRLINKIPRRYNQLMSQLKKYLPFVFFVFIIGGLWIRSITLSSVPFFDWDESIYAQVAREWLRHPGLALHYNGSIWFEKPPLLFAVIGLLFQTFGTSEFIARLPSVVAAICCVVLVFHCIKRITKNMAAQIAGVLIFAATPFFIDRASIVNVDIFLTLGWLLYICDNTFISRLIGTIIGTWTKSFLGLIPLCLDVALSIYHRSLSKKKIREWAVIISTSLIWHVVMTVQYSDLFISSHIRDHLISRVTTPIELHFGGKFFYLEKVWANYPWLAIVACVGIITWIITLVKRRDTKQIDIFFLLPLVYLALLTFSKSKLSWYIVPTLPFVAIWIVYSISHIPRKSLQTLCYFVLIGWSGYMFLRQTIGFTVQGNVIPEQVALARCQKSMPPFTRTAYLVAPTQRKDAQVIEAAQVAIASSFIYGSAPTFVFYLDKPVTFFYKPEIFLGEVSKYDAYAMHTDDLALLSRSAQDAFASNSAVITECQRGNWILYGRTTTPQKYM